jgi:hypothetical protein
MHHVWKKRQPKVFRSDCHPVACHMGFAAATYLALVGLIIGVWVILVGLVLAIIGGATAGNISQALRILSPTAPATPPSPQSA